MAKNNAIVEIQGTDLISESMHKINDNFKILAETEEQDRYKWQTYVDSVNSKIEELKSIVNSKNSVIEENIHTLADDIKNIPTIENLQKQVREAIENASDVVASVITTNAGDYISSALAGYVKTASMNDELRKYVLATSFDTFKSDADKKFATSSRITANSSFAFTNDGYLIYLDGTKSQYDSISSYYNAIKSEIDRDNKGIDDADVYDALMASCESTFKTIVDEMSTIRQDVIEGTASTNIIARVRSEMGKDPNNTDVNDVTDIVAGIFLEANRDNGSSIKLNADQLLLSANHRLNLAANTFTISASNLTVDASGNVSMAGTITAMSGTIGGITIASNAIKSSNNNFSVTSSGVLTATSASITGNITATSLTIQGNGESKSIEDFVKSVGSNMHWGETSASLPSWMSDAIQNGSTEINGGLILTGSILVSDGNGTVTAGMIGHNSTDNDIRFFAGSDVDGMTNAAFRVYEDGTLIARNAEFIEGKFSGTLSFPFQGLGACANCTAVDATWDDSYHDYCGSWLYDLDISQSSSVEIPYTKRYVGNPYSSMVTSNFINLPDDLPAGVIINIIATGYSYKTGFGPVYIGAHNLIIDTKEYPGFDGRSLESICNDSEYGDKKWIKYYDVFFLRLLHFGSGEYYLIQSLGQSEISTNPEVPEGFNYYGGLYDGIGSFVV